MRYPQLNPFDYLNPPKFIFRLSLTSWLLTLSACFSTHLGEYKPPTDLSKLVDSAETFIPLQVANPLSDSSHGYQYLLAALPISRVFPDDLANMLTDKLTLHAGLNRYGLTKILPNTPLLPRLKVKIEDVSINGYDLIVVRRPSASITITGSLHTAKNTVKECSATGSASEYSRFAFTPHLNQVLERATDSAAQQLIACLGLGGAQESYYEAIRSDTVSPALINPAE